MHGQDELQRFHKHLNGQHPNIKFTIEHEKENKLAFLDVLVTRSETRLCTGVYRKPTHTDRYIPFHSHHHRRTITGVLRCMHNRAHRICDSTSRKPEFQQLQSVFQANGFPEDLVKKTLSRRPHPTPPPPPPLNLRVRTHWRSCASLMFKDSARSWREYALPVGSRQSSRQPGPSGRP